MAVEAVVRRMNERKSEPLDTGGKSKTEQIKE
jgi:hypothetical protein